MQARIIKADEEITIGENGKLKESIRVQFMVGEDGPFLRRFAKEGFSALGVQAELDTFAAEIQQLHG